MLPGLTIISAPTAAPATRKAAQALASHGPQSINKDLDTCNWGGLIADGFMTGLLFMPGVGEGEAVASTAENLSQQLLFEEALTNGGTRVEMTLNDPAFQDAWSKYRYTHTSLDGTQTTVHWIQQDSTGLVEQVKIKYINLPRP